jgi:hypothetical protein
MPQYNERWETSARQGCPQRSTQWTVSLGINTGDAQAAYAMIKGGLSSDA